MDVIVLGHSDPEIGALLRDGMNTKEHNLLKNNEMEDYMEALDIIRMNRINLTWSSMI